MNKEATKTTTEQTKPRGNIHSLKIITSISSKSPKIF